MRGSQRLTFSELERVCLVLALEIAVAQYKRDCEATKAHPRIAQNFLDSATLAQRLIDKIEGAAS